MKKSALIALTVLFLLGCGDEETYPSFEVQSPSFGQGKLIPIRHTCDADNISPALMLDDIPANVKTYAVIVEDRDAMGGTFTNWLIWGIPNVGAMIDEGYARHAVYDQDPLATAGIRQGPNSDGKIGYTGPCPSDDEVHEYHFKVYALDRDLDLKPDEVVTSRDLRSAMNGKILGIGELIGVYFD